jgi:hypothetical protein
MVLPELPPYIVLIMVGLGGAVVGKSLRWLYHNKILRYIWFILCIFDVIIGLFLMIFEIINHH